MKIDIVKLIEFLVNNCWDKKECDCTECKINKMMEVNMKIEIYGNENCGKCKIVKNKLEEKNIPHLYSIDEKVLKEKSLKYKSMSLPICVFNNEFKSFGEAVNIINNWN